MQWTPELSALLNQCAFSAGYDFSATCVALKSRAARLRLDCDALTAAACEAQWMLLNPVVEDDELDGPEHSSSDEADPCGWMLEGLAGDTAPSKLVSTDAQGSPDCQQDTWGGGKVHGQRATEESGEPCAVCSSSDDASASAMLGDDSDEGDGDSPRLELSISEADLDELLRELPIRHGNFDADGKSEGSEMQWVLAFLTDPNAAASADAEAKQFAAAASARDIHDDDNYKGFLRDLNDANLFISSPKKSKPVSDARSSASRTYDTGARREAAEEQPQPLSLESEDSDSDTDEWISTRYEIKQRSGRST